MKQIVFFILCYSLTEASINLSRPPGLKFGVATASYQIEGGWNADGKGENIWDRFTHEDNLKIKDNSTGDVACDSYHLWKKDVDLLEELEVDFYRFSLSWSRILPNGFSNYINTRGIAYYNNLIDLLVKKGIEPVVTLYHWDLPQPIQDLGGWTNSITAQYFGDFARIAFDHFGDRVKIWITINEPASICVGPYEFNDGAPNVKSPGIGSYLCGQNILLAHATAYRIYQSEFRHIQNGKVGFTIDSIWAEPKDNNSKVDLEAAEREMQMSFGWFINPIFSDKGDYPDIMKFRIKNASVLQNFTTSRLPQLSEDEIRFIQGSADFLGVNHYHTWLVTLKVYPPNEISFEADKGTELLKDPTWKDPDILPWGLTNLLNWIKLRYNNPLVYITENGIGDSTGTLTDTKRIQYLQEYINATLVAINQGCNVARYTVWSLMDNMEWTNGYT
ncbi:hypothetical protein ABEB36_012728 [Hypothenemus hampei]